MKNSQEQTTKEYIEHEWERKWEKKDYLNHNQELKDINKDWLEAKKRAMESRKAPDWHFQVIRGGLSPDGSYFHDGAKSSSGIPQSYDLNAWMLDKHSRWVEFNMTPEQRRESQERIKAMFEEIRTVSGKMSVKSCPHPID